MHRGLEAIVIALIFATMWSVVQYYAVVIRGQLEYALVSAHRVSAYFLLVSSSPGEFLNRTISLPEARAGLGEFSVVVLVPDREARDFEAVVLSFEP